MSSDNSASESRMPLEEVNSNEPVLMTPRTQSKLPVFSRKRERTPSSNADTSANTSQLVQPSKRSRLEPPAPEHNAGKPPAAKTTRARPQSGMAKSTSGGNLRKQTRGGTATGRPPVSSARSRTRPASAPNSARTTAPSRSAPSSSSTTATRTATNRNTTRSTTTGNNNSTQSNGVVTGKTKRPAWDYKGRLEDMSKEVKAILESNSSLQQVIENTQERVQILEEQKQELSGAVVQKEQVNTATEERNRKLERQLRDQEETNDDLKRKLSRITREKEDLEGDYNAARQEINGYKSTVSQMTSEKLGIESENNNLKRNLEILKEDLRKKMEECEEKKRKIAELEGAVEERDCSLREHEATRRNLHNLIQELKGNIRVFCRVRPLVNGEMDSGVKAVSMDFPDHDQKVIELEKPGEESAVGGARKKDQRYEFTFDKVFSPESQQSHVFEEISQLVQSALDGYNVCIFAYGQTGSGKTFTMEGPDNPDDDHRGMIPRAAEQIFNCARDLEDKGWKYDMKASFLEIYNETIRDLLGPADSKEKHDIKLTGSKGTEVEVTNMTVVEVKSEGQIHQLLQKATQSRAVAATKCNERSSRSHSVFILNLHGRNEMTGEDCEGVLNLVDLAGSERLSQSGSTGSRLKETQNINRSLSELGNVIMALANKDAHIPYRNSKLTHLLQNSLGGNSKTLMFVNISPREENLTETLSSLRFATKVNQCNIGTAQKKVK
ncbi:carboxy-terminal kinesin 2-like isoform X2 [Ptychodera flava]|uniref:carboxy-terminal kinesin 2-like isoform X2 n=1 Tax=Ptychodera flava TaxID=63121 RepID=UPI00396A29C0